MPFTGRLLNAVRASKRRVFETRSEARLGIPRSLRPVRRSRSSQLWARCSVHGAHPQADLADSKPVLYFDELERMIRPSEETIKLDAVHGPIQPSLGLVLSKSRHHHVGYMQRMHRWYERPPSGIVWSVSSRRVPALIVGTSGLQRAEASLPPLQNVHRAILCACWPEKRRASWFSVSTYHCDVRVQQLVFDL